LAARIDRDEVRIDAAGDGGELGGREFTHDLLLFARDDAARRRERPCNPAGRNGRFRRVLRWDGARLRC
jgi:hypothetical protein